MKKFLLCFAILMGVATVSPYTTQVFAVNNGPVCPADSPCLYQGEAEASNRDKITISVHRLGDGTTDFVAKFTKDGRTETVYVFPSGEGDGRWYFTWNGRKYWFYM